MDSPASPSAGSLPADVLAAIAKQRGKNKAPTMTAGEIAKHRSGCYLVNKLNTRSQVGQRVRQGWQEAETHEVRTPLSPLPARVAYDLTVLLGTTTPSSSLCRTKKSCYLVIQGMVFDVTKFLKDHPGGEGGPSPRARARVPNRLPLLRAAVCANP